ncbi:TWiK family of potassium channels protein 18-like [Drosophila miranda]|uniref:TWiK family of potassium channels protein 18-like n=1 Tax=Drosophila miranda TaxID=7229 RepID=UPI00143F9EEF|nr:TWiK family of potassium channels protein 18-like [Drosophila miranda]
MSKQTTVERRKEKPAFQRFKDHCRHFTAFMFSNVGIILLVTFYTIGGAFIFQAIEIFEYERLRSEKPNQFIERNVSGEFLTRIWELTAENISFFDHKAYRKRVNDVLLEYQRAIVKKQLKGPDVEQWSFSGAFLYSLAVITTIGYGNITPHSEWGKLATILYAIIGMPLFLLYLSNIGDVLAKSFKWIYSKVCLCRICPGVAKRRIIRERRKMRHLARALQMHHMESGGGSSSYSSSSSTTNSNSNSSSSTDYTKSSYHSSSIVDVAYSGSDSDIEREIRGSTDEITVPLTVCIFVMVGYILWGALLFGRWEDWNYWDGSYFCLISLSSIGFGDLVPGDRVITADRDKVEFSFILCAVQSIAGNGQSVLQSDAGGGRTQHTSY